MEDHTAYDYRLYDSVWQRVSPGCDPYGDQFPACDRHCTCDEPHTGDMMRTQTPQTLPATVRSEDTLPGAQLNPCCMGSEATESLTVLEGFIEAEQAQRRCFLALAPKLCHGDAARLLRMLARDKQNAVRELTAAYYLITGSCYESTICAQHMRWHSAADALRSCYHREACSGFNYRRAAEETLDLCLQKLFGRLADQSFAGADALMDLLGHMLC